MSFIEKIKDKNTCVKVNIFTKCCKKDCNDEPWEQKEFNKDDCCVNVNVFAECDKEGSKKDDCFPKCNCDDCCVEVNIFVKCNEKKHHDMCDCEK